MSGRCGRENGKLVDVGVLREYRSRGAIDRFEDQDEIVLDVTSMKPEEAAERVRWFVERRRRRGEVRKYDD